MTTTDTQNTSGDTNVNRSSNRVMRLLRAWATGYVALYETRYVGSAPVERTIKPRSIPTV